MDRFGKFDPTPNPAFQYQISRFHPYFSSTFPKSIQSSRKTTPYSVRMLIAKAIHSQTGLLCAVLTGMTIEHCEMRQWNVGAILRAQVSRSLFLLVLISE